MRRAGRRKMFLGPPTIVYGRERFSARLGTKAAARRSPLLLSHPALTLSPPPVCPPAQPLARRLAHRRTIGRSFRGMSSAVSCFQLAEVARTPWLDPYVAGGILAAKALSEGDWRIGKGALAGWADRALCSLSDTGAKVLRVGSGQEVRQTPRSSLSGCEKRCTVVGEQQRMLAEKENVCPEWNLVLVERIYGLCTE